MTSLRLSGLTAMLLLLLSVGLLPSLALAQSIAASGVGTTLEVLQKRIQAVEAATEMAETTRTSLLEFYRRAVSMIEQRHSFDEAADNFIRAREVAPRESIAIRNEIKRLESSKPAAVDASLSRQPLSALEQLLLSNKAELTTLRNRLAEFEELLSSQIARPEQARQRLGDSRVRQQQVAEALKAPVPEDEIPRLSEARRWALELESRAIAAEIEMLNQELLSQPMRIERLGARRDRATLDIRQKQRYVELLEAQVVERRRAEAEFVTEEAEATERQTAGKHPLVQELAQKNTQLGEELKQQAAALEQVSSEENIATDQVKRVADNFRLARQKLEIAGLSEALGQVLLEQRARLPAKSDFLSATKRRQRLLIDSSLRQIRNQQERDRLRDINAYLTELLDALLPFEQDRLRDEILELAQSRRDLLDKAIAADDTYLQALGELDFAQRQLSETVADYNAFLDERLLWIRSGETPSWQTLNSITESLAIFLSLAHWRELLLALFVPDSFPGILLAGLALFTLLLVKAKAIHASLERSSRNVGQMRHDRILATLRALLQTLVLALPWPVLFTALGLHLQYWQGLESLDLESHLYQTAVWTGQFVPAIGAAFSGIALYTFYFIAFRVFCEPRGLAVSHFGWNALLCEKLRLETRRLMSVFLPAAFILIASITYDPAALASGLSRLTFIIILTALAWFFGRILTPGRGVLHEFYASSPHNPMVWFRYLWLVLGLVLPIVLAILVAIGYVYTASQFGARLVDTLWLIVAVILVQQLVVRWVLVVERRLVFMDTLQRLRAQRRKGPEQTAPGAAPAVQPDEPEIDYSTLGEDTKKLIITALTVLAAFGLWAIWSDVLPAFRILDDVSLWSYSTTVDGGSKLVPVTLNDLILSLVIVVIGLIAARRLPALLEIVLLARLNVTAGSRYAISTLTQYAIVALGIVLVFNLLGGRWSEIQWLVAALGVGIGFGLQEIVANFISGLILLFERPIRIGDTVTVGDTSGVVTRIRIRSTTIRDWDQHELVVPNKEFITGRLLNWTLTDSITRIIFPIGIAYGSDVALAVRLVQDAATEHERVLEEPGPMVTFESFGDNALTIMLRCYIGSLDYRLATISELHQAINDKFAAAKIEIAFPQRDIHLDTSSPLDIRLHRAPPESS